MSEFSIRESVPFDLDAILKIERENASAAHWNEDAYAELWDNPETKRICFVAECDGLLLGFVVAHEVADDWELENIAVALSAQNLGIGSALFERLIEVLSKAAAERLLLEVRESNVAARRLYESKQMVVTGRRKNYYHNPEEDALLFEKKITNLSMKIR